MAKAERGTREVFFFFAKHVSQRALVAAIKILSFRVAEFFYENKTSLILTFWVNFTTAIRRKTQRPGSCCHPLRFLSARVEADARRRRNCSVWISDRAFEV